MSKMTKMLRYQTSSGATGACAIYTTVDECPNPNLKVQVDGTNGYVKLSGDSNDPNKTPIKVYVNSSGQTLSALTQAIPTGSLRITFNNTFTVPAGITVIKYETKYISVLPNSTHYIEKRKSGTGDRAYYYVHCATHNHDWGRTSESSSGIDFYWSPEINNHSTDVNCY